MGHRRPPGKRQQMFTLKVRLGRESVEDIIRQAGPHYGEWQSDRYINLPENVSRAIVRQAAKQFTEVSEDMEQQKRAFEIIRRFENMKFKDPKLDAAEEALAQRRAELRKEEEAIYRRRIGKRAAFIMKQFKKAGITRWITRSGYSIESVEATDAAGT